ncbi:hypothetical protein SLEP1_g30363 [Rubroshorea leprosula]|uniref:Uncharacterized protein n=1 Tax=Rubroshorea leprosula TaxID=152421 RepID=A0AAV5K9Q3_9ROSI|nr:hypothetical protein SLEP1_g30363 [Rubroshorea leprosula]
MLNKEQLHGCLKLGALKMIDKGLKCIKLNSKVIEVVQNWGDGMKKVSMLVNLHTK